MAVGLLQGALEGFLNRPAGVNARQMSAIFGRGIQVGIRFHPVGGVRGCFFELFRGG